MEIVADCARHNRRFLNHLLPRPPADLLACRHGVKANLEIQWRTTGECDILLVVGDEPLLSRSDLDEYQRQLSLLSDAGVEKEYQRCWEGSRFDGKHVPP